MSGLSPVGQTSKTAGREQAEAIAQGEAYPVRGE
jgi:hypothetical protein